MPKKKINVHAKSWKVHCRPAVTHAPRVDPALTAAGAVNPKNDTNMDTDAAVISAAGTITTTTTTTTPSTREDVSLNSDAAPLVVSTQDDSDDVREPALHYIVVPYRKYRDSCMIETAAFGDEKSSLKTKLERLMACLAGVANPLRAPRVKHMLQEDGSSVPFFVIEIGELAERVELQSWAVKSDDGATSWRYLPLSEDQQLAEERRSIDIRSLQYDTKDHQIVAALTEYGKVERVKMGFNRIKSMATAQVTFATADAVNSMIKRGITCILVGQDSGLIARLGETHPEIDYNLTLKLTHLPFGCTPRDVVKALADVPYFGITVPLDFNTRRRKMEAFVYFSNSHDQETARAQDFRIGKADKITAWAEASASTCYGCGAVGHSSKKCTIRSQELSIRQLHQKNADPLSPIKQQHKAPVQQITAAKGRGKATSSPLASVWTTSKASALLPTASTMTSNTDGPSRQAIDALQHAPAAGHAPAAATSYQESQLAWEVDYAAMCEEVRELNLRYEMQMLSQLQRLNRRFDHMEHMLLTYCAQAAPARNLPPTLESVGKIADLEKRLAQARMENEHNHKVIVAMQNELASIRNFSSFS